MAFCNQCGQEAAEHAKFCSACGNDLRAEKKDGDPCHAARHKGEPFKPAQRGSPEGVETYEALMRDTASRQTKAWIAGIACFLLAVSSYVSYQSGSLALCRLFALCAMLAFIASRWFSTPSRLSHGEYQSLPGAVTDQGHQCVFCGGRGVYRHTPYKTDTTLADCSRCKAELWYE